MPALSAAAARVWMGRDASSRHRERVGTATHSQSPIAGCALRRNGQKPPSERLGPAAPRIAAAGASRATYCRGRGQPPHVLAGCGPAGPRLTATWGWCARAI